MTQAPKEYEIRKITDLLEIPEDKIEFALKDLLEWYMFTKQMAEELSDELSVQVVPAAFVWVDDGIDGLLEVRLTDSDRNQIASIKRPNEKRPHQSPGA